MIVLSSSLCTVSLPRPRATVFLPSPSSFVAFQDHQGRRGLSLPPVFTYVFIQTTGDGSLAIAIIFCHFLGSPRAARVVLAARFCIHIHSDHGRWQSCCRRRLLSLSGITKSGEDCPRCRFSHTYSFRPQAMAVLPLPLSFVTFRDHQGQQG
jgi:hypothetical protein